MKEINFAYPAFSFQRKFSFFIVPFLIILGAGCLGAHLLLHQKLKKVNKEINLIESKIHQLNTINNESKESKNNLYGKKIKDLYALSNTHAFTIDNVELKKNTGQCAITTTHLKTISRISQRFNKLSGIKNSTLLTISKKDNCYKLHYKFIWN